MGRDGTPPRPWDSRIVGVTWNVNGLQNVRKRREMIRDNQEEGDGCVGSAGGTFERKWNAS